MMLRPMLKTAPSVKPVSVDEVKANSRISGTDDDALVGSLIDAALSHVDGWGGILGRCLINQVWTLKFACWPACGLPLAFPDVSAVAVKYFDSNGAEQPLSSAGYRLIETDCGSALEWVSGFALPSLAVRADAISVDVTAGYGATADDVPMAIRHAIKLLVAHWYENREASVIGATVADLPFAVGALLAPHRRTGI